MSNPMTGALPSVHQPLQVGMVVRHNWPAHDREFWVEGMQVYPEH